MNLKNNIINQLEDRVSELERSMKGPKVNKIQNDNVEEVNQLTKERDELKERLLKFETLKDDISEIETIKEENESLKKTSPQVKESVDEEIEEQTTPFPRRNTFFPRRIKKVYGQYEDYNSGNCEYLMKEIHLVFFSILVVVV